MRVKYSSIFWVLSLFALPVVAQTETPHPGPRSDEEANLLFTEGTQFLVDKKFSEASGDFSRFVNRYPSHTKIEDAYLGLLESLYNEKKYEDVVRYAKEFLNLKAPAEKGNRARQFQGEADLSLHEYLAARLSADELEKNAPTPRQKAAIHSIKFQAFIEEKLYSEAHQQLDDLEDVLKKDPAEPFLHLIPEFKMTLDVRECQTSHLLRNKSFEETDLMEYFSKKNLCFKSALPNAVNGMGDATVQEWCQSFTFLNHELESMKIDASLKEKMNKDLKATFEFSKTLSPGFSKCYEPYKPKPAKSKKRHRKRRVHPPRDS